MLKNARLRVEKGVIRTFNARRGRISKGQDFALTNYFPEYELIDGPWDFEKLFDSKEVYFEIGCGAGESTIGFADNNPEKIIIASEVHRPGISHLVKNAYEKDLKNIRVLYTDGVQVLRDWVPDSSLTAILAFFPDPWQKKRHHKRRLFRAEIIELMIKKLKPNGEIIIATDWGQYAEEILELLPNSGKTVRPSWRPETKYERKGRLAGREITEIRAKF